MRVLLFSKVNPADGGGVQAVCRRLTARLRALGCDVLQAWSRPDPTPDPPTMTLHLAVVEEGQRVRKRLPALLKSSLALSRRLAQWRPDIVNSHFVTAETAYLLLLRPLFGYKVVLSVHGSDVLRPRPRDAALVPRLLRRADAITVVSEAAAAPVRRLLADTPVPLRVIPNGVDCAFWEAARRGSRPLDSRRPTVLTVGRLHPVKGHDVLLPAFAQLVSRIPGARLIVVGDGPDRGALERQAAELGVTQGVSFTGGLPPEVVRDHMADCRAFVLPSRSEGLPLALLEAMAAGLPVIATRVGGVPEVLDAGQGLMVPPEDPGALTAAMQRLLEDPRLGNQLARAAAERVRHFTAESSDRAYYEVFQQVLAGVRSRPTGIRLADH